VRIALAGITNEALAWSPLPTRGQDFRVLRGDQILTEPIYRLGEVAERLQVEPVPLLTANHIAPGGTVELSAYLQLRQEILTGLSEAGPLDGVCLLLHGAMLVEHIGSGEADLVREIRAVVGREVRISARLDLHATLTEDFANRTSIWTGFRTAPHRDMVQTTVRAFTLLAEVIRNGKDPRPVFVRVPLLLPGEKATTDVEPMRSLEQMAREIEQQPGILNAEVFVGFGWADSPHSSSSVAVIAEDPQHLPQARGYARQLAQEMWDRRHEFRFDQEVVDTVEEGLKLALAAPEPSVWLTDSGDNPTAGTPGDSTYFLSALLQRQVPDAILASVPDEAAWRACVAAGVDGTVDLELGGHWDHTVTGPLQVRGVVEHLYDGDLEAKVAPMATVRIGGVRVIVTGLRKSITTLDDFRRAGLEPLQHQIVVVKLGYLMPQLRDAAPREVLVQTPGYSDMRLDRLPYRYVTRPIFPLDADFPWRPLIGNVASYGE
jgi:microcystin degradation protein MlrC